MRAVVRPLEAEFVAYRMRRRNLELLQVEIREFALAVERVEWRRRSVAIAERHRCDVERQRHAAGEERIVELADVHADVGMDELVRDDVFAAEEIGLMDRTVMCLETIAGEEPSPRLEP